MLSGLAVAVGLAVGETSTGALFAQAQGTPPQQLPIEARWCVSSQVCIDLEVADQPEEQRLGLMQRPPLPPLRGMWFPFQRRLPLKFWMHNTIAPLDMVFVLDNRVIGVHRDVPFCSSLPCPSYGADVDADGKIDPADGVIELGAGEAERLGIQLGDPVLIKPLKSG